MGALSLATDLAAGQPPETALGATVIAVRIGRKLGLSESELADTYYGSITRFLGCTSTAVEGAAMALGQDGQLNYALSLCDWIDPDAVEASLQRHLAPEAPPAERRASIRVLREHVADIPSLAQAHCAQAQMLAARLPLPAGVETLLSHIYDRWDDKKPGASGAGVPLPARILSLAASAELFRRAGGVQAAVDMARQRAGCQFDPELCALLARDAARLFEGLGGASNWDLYLDHEPGAARRLPADMLRGIGQAFADYVDQKSGLFLGHSRQVATLAFRAGEAAGLAAPEREELYVAALVHDIGRAAVPNAVWDKRGPLSAMEQRQARSHSYQTEMVLSLAGAFAKIAGIAASAHERCDGSGYHRRTRLDDRRAGLLAAADVYNALTHDRPWRAAYAAGEAADRLLAEAAAGRLPPHGVRAVLEAAGHGKRASARAYPAGLTRREAQVLEHLARGRSTKEIAAKLGISAKTADHHVQSLYEKTGARGRAAAALYALEHGILEE